MSEAWRKRVESVLLIKIKSAHTANMLPMYIILEEQHHIVREICIDSTLTMAYFFSVA